MTTQDQWFIKERAVAFASLLLTEHNDVTVRGQAGADKGIDLLAEIRRNGKSTLRFFGVRIVASLDLPDVSGADAQDLAHSPGDRNDVTLPLCVFRIGVRKPEGRYQWVVEPVVENGRALLRRDGEPTWQTLDEVGIARLIGQVNEWYDALQDGPTRKKHDRQPKTDS